MSDYMELVDHEGMIASDASLPEGYNKEDQEFDPETGEDGHWVKIGGKPVFISRSKSFNYINDHPGIIDRIAKRFRLTPQSHHLLTKNQEELGTVKGLFHTMAIGHTIHKLGAPIGWDKNTPFEQHHAMDEALKYRKAQLLDEEAHKNDATIRDRMVDYAYKYDQGLDFYLGQNQLFDGKDREWPLVSPYGDGSDLRQFETREDAESEAKKMYPHIKWDLSGCDDFSASQIVSTCISEFEAIPEICNYIKNIVTTITHPDPFLNGDRNFIACWSQTDRSIIFNADYTHNHLLLESSIVKSVINRKIANTMPFHGPGDANIGYSTHHELGHAFEFMILYEGELRNCFVDNSVNKTTAGKTDESHSGYNDATLSNGLGSVKSFLDLFEEQKLDFVSEYSKKNDREKWAECWASAWSASPQEIEQSENKETILSMQRFIEMLQRNRIRPVGSRQFRHLSQKEKYDIHNKMGDIAKEIGIKVKDHSTGTLEEYEDVYPYRREEDADAESDAVTAPGYDPKDQEFDAESGESGHWVKVKGKPIFIPDSKADEDAHPDTIKRAVSRFGLSPESHNLLKRGMHTNKSLFHTIAIGHSIHKLGPPTDWEGIPYEEHHAIEKAHQFRSADNLEDSVSESHYNKLINYAYKHDQGIGFYRTQVERPNLSEYIRNWPIISPYDIGSERIRYPYVSDAEEAGRKKYPNIKWNLKGCDVPSANAIVRAIFEMFDDIPDMSKYIKIITTYSGGIIDLSNDPDISDIFNVPSNASACFCKKDGVNSGIIGFNSNHVSNYKLYRFCTENNITRSINKRQEPYHPLGSDGIYSVTKHELGHAFEFMLRDSGQLGYSFTDNSITTHDSIDWRYLTPIGTVESILDLFIDQKVSCISEYAKVDDREKWAEAWAGALTASYEQISQSPHKDTYLAMKKFINIVSNRKFKRPSKLILPENEKQRKHLKALKEIYDIIKELDLKVKDKDGNLIDYPNPYANKDEKLTGDTAGQNYNPEDQEFDPESGKDGHWVSIGGKPLFIPDDEADGKVTRRPGIVGRAVQRFGLSPQSHDLLERQRHTARSLFHTIAMAKTIHKLGPPAFWSQNTPFEEHHAIGEAGKYMTAYGLNQHDRPSAGARAQLTNYSYRYDQGLENYKSQVPGYKEGVNWPIVSPYMGPDEELQYSTVEEAETAARQKYPNIGWHLGGADVQSANAIVKAAFKTLDEIPGLAEDLRIISTYKEDENSPRQKPSLSGEVIGVPLAVYYAESKSLMMNSNFCGSYKLCQFLLQNEVASSLSNGQNSFSAIGGYGVGSVVNHEMGHAYDFMISRGEPSEHSFVDNKPEQLSGDIIDDTSEIELGTAKSILDLFKNQKLKTTSEYSKKDDYEKWAECWTSATSATDDEINTSPHKETIRDMQKFISVIKQYKPGTASGKISEIVDPEERKEARGKIASILRELNLKVPDGNGGLVEYDENKPEKAWTDKLVNDAAFPEGYDPADQEFDPESGKQGHWVRIGGKPVFVLNGKSGGNDPVNQGMVDRAAHRFGLTPQSYKILSDNKDYHTKKSLLHTIAIAHTIHKLGKPSDWPENKPFEQHHAMEEADSNYGYTKRLHERGRPGGERTRSSDIREAHQKSQGYYFYKGQLEGSHDVRREDFPPEEQRYFNSGPEVKTVKETEDYLKGKYPDMTFNLTGCDPKCAEAIASVCDKVFEIIPDLSKYIAGIFTFKPGETLTINIKGERVHYKTGENMRGFYLNEPRLIGLNMEKLSDYNKFKTKIGK